MLAKYLKPSNNNTNPLQKQVQQLLDDQQDDNDRSAFFRLGVDKEWIRQAIGESFVEEPVLKWSMNHFDRNQVLQTQEELVHFCRFVNSYPLLEDLDAPLHFQICEMDDTNNIDDDEGGTIVSCASLQAYHPHPPRGPLWLRSLLSSWSTVVQTLRIIYGFGDPLPSAFQSLYMSRLLAKTQKWVDNVEEWHYKYGPSRPHWTLHLIGVNPKYNGQGKGKVMMNKLCDLADQLDQDIYLEAGGNLNSYYEKFGFVVKGVETLVDPEDASSTIDVHLMVREAKQETTNDDASK